jgi:hypothetical protein
MIHLIIAVVVLVGTLYFVISMIVLVCRVIWLCVLLVAFCVLSVITAVLAVLIGCHKLIQVVDEWKWRRRYGEVLPPETYS